MSPLFEIIIGRFPNMCIFLGFPRYMYAIPPCVVDLAIEVHLFLLLVPYGGRQTPKLVGAGDARVETSARQG